MRDQLKPILSAGILAALIFAGTAHAAWLATASGSGAARALTMPAGPTPSLTATTSSATVSWTASTIGGAPASSYTIKRYDSGNVAQSVGASCSGAIVSTSCTESGLPAGRWKYTVTPRKGLWTGSESPYSAVVRIVAAPRVTCANCGGSGSGYINGSMSTSVTVNVALPASSEAGDVVNLTLSDGTNVVTPAAKAGTAGAGTVQWTGVSTAALNQGAITFRAWVTASSGEISPDTTSGYTKDTVAPTAIDINGVNRAGGTAGKLEAGDMVVYTFSEQMSLTSLGAASVTATITNASSNDRITINSANYGSVATGANHVGANRTFPSSSVAQAAAVVTITLGTPSGTTSTVASGTIVWTPSASATDLAGNAMSTTARTESGGSDQDF